MPAAKALTPSRTDSIRLWSQLLLQQLVELGRIGLPARGLHHLANEEAKQLVLATAVVGKLTGVLRHHLIDRLFDRGGIRDLPQAFLFDDRVSALARRPHPLEHFLGDLPGD